MATPARQTTDITTKTDTGGSKDSSWWYNSDSTVVAPKERENFETEKDETTEHMDMEMGVEDTSTILSSRVLGFE